MDEARSARQLETELNTPLHESPAKWGLPEKGLEVALHVLGCLSQHKDNDAIWQLTKYIQRYGVDRHMKWLESIPFRSNRD